MLTEDQITRDLQEHRTGDTDRLPVLWRLVNVTLAVEVSRSNMSVEVIALLLRVGVV